MQSTAAFWDKVSVKYAKQPIADEAAYQLTLDKTKGYLKADDHVLEVGCGTGSTALLLAENVQHITASDISGKMIEIGRGKAEAQDVSNIDFIQSDLLDDAFTEKTYDAVLAHNMLHLIEDMPSAIQSIHSLLEPGGIFVSKTVCTFGAGAPLKWYLLKLALPIMQFFGKAPYVNFMNVKELESLIENSGFTILESGNYPETALSRYIVARKT